MDIWTSLYPFLYENVWVAVFLCFKFIVSDLSTVIRNNYDMFCGVLLLMEKQVL